jgi:hypothetical protein
MVAPVPGAAGKRKSSGGKTSREVLGTAAAAAEATVEGAERAFSLQRLLFHFSSCCVHPQTWAWLDKLYLLALRWLRYVVAARLSLCSIWRARSAST